MPIDYQSFEDHRVKHLEMIQAVIARLGHNSFLIKGWAVTVGGVFFGFAVNKTNSGLALVSLVPTVLFWLLDTYFLRTERLYRALHNRVRDPDSAVEPFFMAATAPSFVNMVKASDDKNAASRLSAFSSVTLVALYGGLIIAALVVAVVICSG